MWKMYKTKVIYENFTKRRAKVMIFDSSIYGMVKRREKNHHPTKPRFKIKKKKNEEE